MFRAEWTRTHISCTRMRQKRIHCLAARIPHGRESLRVKLHKSEIEKQMLRAAPLDRDNRPSCSELRVTSGIRGNATNHFESTTAKIVSMDEDRQEQLIKQLKESRSQISRRLSEANQYASYLEHRMEEGNQAMHEAFRIMQKVIDELDALSCLTVSVAASLKFAVDEDETIQRLSALQKRLDITHRALEKEKDTISRNCPRTVPITWVGVAQEVRIMGDFDGWTRGKELSAEEISEQVMSEFTGTLELLPGQYEFKFLVNDEWRLTDAFPTVTNEAGVTNNLLIVD